MHNVVFNVTKFQSLIVRSNCPPISRPVSHLCDSVLLYTERSINILTL